MTGLEAADMVKSIILGVAWAFAGHCITSAYETNWWMNDAVKSGHAEYYLDDKHERQWRWLPVQHESTEAK